MFWAQWVEGGAAASILQGSIPVSDGAWLVWGRARRWVLGRKTGVYEGLVRPTAPPLSSLRAWHACFFLLCVVFLSIHHITPKH